MREGLRLEADRTLAGETSGNKERKKRIKNIHNVNFIKKFENQGHVLKKLNTNELISKAGQS